MTDDFELGREDEMEPTSSVTFLTLLRLHFYIYLKIEINPLKSIETNYMDTNPGMFIKNLNLFLTEERNT